MLKKYPNVIAVLGGLGLLFLLGRIVSFSDRSHLDFLSTPSPQASKGSIITVTTLDDSFGTRHDCRSNKTDCSLRNAIQYSGGGEINFAPGLTGTILLEASIEISDTNVTITGPSDDLTKSITISGAGRIGRDDELFALPFPGSLTLKNLTLTGAKRGSFGGGAISNRQGRVLLEHCQIHSNIGHLGGGAIFNEHGLVTIIDSAIVGNSAGIYDPTFGSGPNDRFYGGAIYNEGGLITIIGSEVRGNRAAGDGGAIYNHKGKIEIKRSSFSGNQANNLNVSNEPVSNILLMGRGGVIFNDGGDLTITNTTFDNNNSHGSGGAIYNASGQISIGNSTFDYNQTYVSGGGIYNATGSLTITNSTFSYNQAANFLGGSAVFSADGTISVKNTILANNGENNCRGFIWDGGHNLQYPGQSCGNSILSADPKLEQFYRAFRLSAGSPAIDAGDNTVCAADPINNVDQLGALRPVDGGSGKALCDIGAVEYNSATPTPTITPTPMP